MHTKYLRIYDNRRADMWPTHAVTEMHVYQKDIREDGFQKNLNAAKPPEQSRGLGGIRKSAVRTKIVMENP